MKVMHQTRSKLIPDEDQRPRRRRGDDRNSLQIPQWTAETRNVDANSAMTPKTKTMSSVISKQTSEAKRKMCHPTKMPAPDHEDGGGGTAGARGAEQNDRDQDTDTRDNSDTEDDPLLSTSAFGDDQDDDPKIDADDVGIEPAIE